MLFKRFDRLFRIGTAFPLGSTGFSSIGHLLQILLASGVNPWVVVYWLTAPIKERENQRPIDLVDQDEQTRNLLLNMAREDAARWHMVWQHNE